MGYLSDAAGYVGRVSRAVQQEHARALQQSGVSGETTLIVGGQIRGQAPDIFLVYPQGNYMEGSDDTPFLQIGESKYGKPMLDRIAAPSLSLEQAARLALVSLDATIRSNITVGPPFDLALYATDRLSLDRHLRVEFDSPFYTQLRTTWQDGIRQTFDALPAFDRETGG